MLNTLLYSSSSGGLTIAGTRITIYDVMDHLVAGWTPKLIRNWLPLAEEQLNAALCYIDTNRSKIEAEYQIVLQETQARREYWEEKNRERLEQMHHYPWLQSAVWIDSSSENIENNSEA